MRQNGAITRVKWGQEVNADEFEEVSLVNPHVSQQPGQYNQEAVYNRRAKSGGGRFTGMYDLCKLVIFDHEIKHFIIYTNKIFHRSTFSIDSIYRSRKRW